MVGLTNITEQFEYRVKSAEYSISKTIEEFNKLGLEGWELVSKLEDNIGRPQYIFKRRKTLN